MNKYQQNNDLNLKYVFKQIKLFYFAFVTKVGDLHKKNS